MADESNYLDIIEKNRSGGVEHAATTPVFYERPARRRLTKNRKRAKLLKSASDKTRAAKSGERKTSSRTRKTPKMASKKQKAAARRNIKKAQAAKRAKAASRSRAAKKAARTRKAKHSRKATRKAAKHTARKARKSSKRSRAAKKAARTRKANKAARKAARKASRKSRKSSRRPKHSRKARKASRRRARRSTSLKLPRKARKVYVVAAEKRRRRHSGGRRRGAMENPMTGVEIFVGSITGLAGFGLADFVDRMLATHALTDKNAKDANGQELYADNPPADGNYVGLFNPTAICAPMDWKRWIFGLLGAAVPLGAAQLVSGPTARSALQFFGFGYGVRVVGKGLIDGLALLTKSTGMGQRLYDGEMRAAVLKANNGNNQANELASLPAAGLGQPKALAGAPCKDCGDKQQAAGAGYPSMPREVAPSGQTTTSATPPAPPPSPATPPSAFNPGPLTGTPSNGAAKKRGMYQWGEPIN